MLLTVWCIAVVLFSILAVGIPVRWLLGGCKPLNTGAWIEAPFLGVATIVVILQNLVYLDVPIGRSTLFFWLGILILWVFVVRSKQVRASILACPYWLLLAALVVYLVQGLGLLLVGAQYYVGRAWSDQMNYTGITQFLMDEAFSTPLSAIGQRPYLAVAITKKWDRIGQSVLHGFFATSSLNDAKTLFEPTILLLPALIVCAIFALGVKMGLTKWRALAAGIAAGLLPSVAMVHLESFLSQALMMPFVILFPVLLNDLAKRPGWSRLTIAALIFAAATSIYTEFWVIFIALLFLHFLVVIVHHQQYKRVAGCYVALALAPFALIPVFAPGIRTIAGRVGLPVLQSLYPWAFQMEGLSRLWLGDLAIAPWLPPSISYACGILLTVLVYAGLLRLAVARIVPVVQDWRDPIARQPLALILIVLACTMSPVLVLVGGTQNPYQFYKLLLSMSPLFVLGLAWLGQTTRSPIDQPMPARRTVWRYRIATTLVIGTVIALGSSGTVAAAIQSSSAQPRPRHNNFLLVNPGVRELQVTLEGLRGKNLLVTEPGGYLNGWVTYFGRYNQIWLGSANINGVNLADVPTASSLFDLSQLPDDTLILSNTANSRSMIPEGATVVWSGIAYTLWTPGTSNWAIILEVVNKNGIERSNGKDFFWMNTDDTIVRVLSSKTGVLQITAAFMLGPSVSGSAGRSLAISNTSGDHHQLIVGNEERTVAVPVQKGGNEIVFHAFDQPNVSALPNGEPRTLVLGVRGLWVTLAK